MKKITFNLPEPPSVNTLLRMHYRERTKLRNDIEMRIRAQKPKGWKTLDKYRIDAELTLFSLRDPLELWACLKLHADSAVNASIVLDDGPKHCFPGIITQKVNRKKRGLVMTISEYIET